MSLNDFIAISNNSINENIYNQKKQKSTIHQIKKLLIKPLMARLRKTNTNTYKKSPQPEFYKDQDEDDCCREIDDNLANERLEQQIFDEIDCCEESAAIKVYHNGHMDIVPVFRNQRYIPVNFARTEAGTFFWTSMMDHHHHQYADGDINCSGDRNSITNHQRAELQTAGGRWAQA